MYEYLPIVTLIIGIAIGYMLSKQKQKEQERTATLRMGKEKPNPLNDVFVLGSEEKEIE